ncbi:hypothetical protein AB205_0101560 [Aquarana catesbeiana]|uniref:Uncharacterized protein n=1 Tax=Aquarana catesbeiana TaxID=8400 RepID=A0A2G9RIU5_AQUCT|nr:hypothetical protein AB205_0101560 [Aquarana catesbeiana]
MRTCVTDGATTPQASVALAPPRILPTPSYPTDHTAPCPQGRVQAAALPHSSRETGIPNSPVPPLMEYILTLPLYHTVGTWTAMELRISNFTSQDTSSN